MDPITSAILAVLPGLAADTMKSSVKDAYEGLKAVIRRKYGEANSVSKAISEIEGDPHSKARAGVLEEKVGVVRAAEDGDVLKALRTMVDAMKADGMGGEAAARIEINISGGAQTGIIGAHTVTAENIAIGKT